MSFGASAVNGANVEKVAKLTSLSLSVCPYAMPLKIRKNLQESVSVIRLSRLQFDNMQAACAHRVSTAWIQTQAEDEEGSCKCIQ